MHLQDLLSYLAGPSFALLWALIVSDGLRNLKAEFWVKLDANLKQLVIAGLTVIGPMAVANLIAGVPVATVNAADQWFYPIAMIIGRIYFVYRSGKPVVASSDIEKALLGELAGVLPAKDS